MNSMAGSKGRFFEPGLFRTIRMGERDPKNSSSITLMGGTHFVVKAYKGVK